ncbi:T9SS type A sorting domain-containing protein [bacterium]|nr:T9SS type A sorting domain-containing protein [bacterium]
MKKIITLLIVTVLAPIAYGQEIVSFSPNLSFVYEGETGVSTGPMPLTIVLDSAVGADYFISITSSNPNALSIVNGGVTIPAGQNAAPVLVNALSQSGSVTLTAINIAQTLQVEVRVVGLTEVPEIVDLVPERNPISPGDSTSVLVTLNIPARSSGEIVDLSLDPQTAGVIPSSILIQEGEISAEFKYVDGNNVSSCTISATLEDSSSTTTIVIDSTLSAEQLAVQTLAAFPNPFNNHITFSNTLVQQSTIEIYNLLSEEIIEQSFFSELTLDTRDFETGIYLYILKDEQGRLIKRGKIIKAK